MPSSVGKMHVTGQTAAQGASVQCMQAIETERSPGLPIIDRDDTAAVDPPRHLVLVLAGSDAGIAVDASVASQRNFMRAIAFALSRCCGSPLKKTVLELGGSDPYLVLADADLDLAATVCARGRLINTGQSGIAVKRFIVVDKVHDRFVELFVKRMAAPKMGDPLKQDTEIGPLVGMIFGTRCIDRSRAASQRARAACSAARFRGGPAPIIRQPSLPK
jgi:acyl-CoA reductase-like NAD-dependent aldehyde dehydrogenase